MSGLRVVAAWILVLSVGGGCAPSRLTMGEPVALERLDELRIGESSEGRVRHVLGGPDGRGRAWLPIHDGPRSVWVYRFEFEERGFLGPLRAGRTHLWVFLDRGIYDGYLWLSSVPEDVRAER